MVFLAQLLESWQVLAFQKVEFRSFAVGVCPSLSSSLDVSFLFECLFLFFACLVDLKCSFFLVFNPLTVDEMDLERKAAKQLLLGLTFRCWLSAYV